MPKKILNPSEPNVFDFRLEKYKDQCDYWETFSKVYEEGGDSLLREYSEMVHSPDRGLGESVDEGYYARLVCCISTLSIPQDKLYGYFHNLPKKLLKWIASSPNSPEELIELVWIGDYYDRFGDPMPDAASTKAFFHNYQKALSIYARRPDLRVVIEPDMVIWFEDGLSGSGYISVVQDKPK